jgi:hypothetical protein
MTIEYVTTKLLQYCRANDWAGFDPYDALNSRLLQALPLPNSRLLRIAATQALKRSPLNLRPVLAIPGAQNPKALALFISALLRLAASTGTDYKADVAELFAALAALRAPGIPYWCWGYSFPWQTRTVLIPRGEPNLVCTTFVADALLDLYDFEGDQRCLDMAISAAAYLRNELFWTNGSTAAGFAYPHQTARNQVYNANFLASALLCRVYRYTGDAALLAAALHVARLSAASQRPDGSWFYGDAPSQGWIDNFHTGYDLCALRSIALYADTSEFDERISEGFAFYRRNFFCPDGSVKYFHDREYPKDIHCVAQSIITLSTLKDLEPSSVHLANIVLRWALRHMWDKDGYFYYRVHKFCTIRTSYMRWSQAWMLQALAALLSSDLQSRSPQVSMTRSVEA